MSEVDVMDDYRACRCGFAGTNITPDGNCATCGEPLNRESVAWLAKDYGRLHTEHRGAVDALRFIAGAQSLVAARESADRALRILGVDPSTARGR